MKHTPGPWRVSPWTYNNGETTKMVVQNNTDAVAEIWNLYRPNDLGHAEQRANARLIAAAPTMHNAIELALGYLRCGTLCNRKGMNIKIQQAMAVLSDALNYIGEGEEK